jgi:hypothetical protein
MSGPMDKKEIGVAQRALRKAPAAVISMIGVFLLTISVARLGGQETNSSNSQASAAGAAGKMATVPAGARLMVKMIDAVDSDKSQPNDRFRGSLEAPLMAGDTIVAPKGTTVFGRLLTAESSGRGSGGQLEFDLTDIMINGQMHSLATSSNQAEGQSPSGQTGTGAKTGAAVGAVTGGLGGAMRGAGAGAVAGAISGGTTSGQRVSVPAGTLVEFTLDHPVSLPVATR